MTTMTATLTITTTRRTTIPGAGSAAWPSASSGIAMIRATRSTMP
jgi:hypothetical protein